jgi:hypothetical protein
VLLYKSINEILEVLMDRRLKEYKKLNVEFTDFKSPVKVCTSTIDISNIMEKESEEVIEL